MRINYVIILTFLLLFGCVTAQNRSNSSVYEDDANDHCDAYCFNTLKNLLPTIEETKVKLKNYEDLIQSKNEQILELKKKLADLERHNVKIKQNRICSNTEASGVSLFEAQINKTTDDFNLQDLNSNTLNWLSNGSQIEDDLFEDYGNDPIEALKDSTLNKTDELQVQDLPLNCLKYAESTYIYEIWVPNVGNHMVLCDEFGWIVILNRFNGSENFYRKWYEYRSGFGYLEDEFFIGLEVLHQMTSSQGYDIRIELTSFDDYVYHADYSNFIIGSEQEKYSLKSIGGHHGNLENVFESNIGQKFTTFDSDNDKWVEGNCAVHYSSAGWFDKVATMNLFGKYLHSEVMDEQGIWWKDNKTWKAVKITMRPEKKEQN